ncbi:hypothetical protein D3C87_1233380 [compost metagenome]
MAQGVVGPLVVGVGEHQNFTGTERGTGIQCRRLALAGQVEHGDARVDNLACASHGVIGGAIAGQNDLQRARLIILGQHGAQFFFDVPRLVVRGNHNAHVHRRRRTVPARGKERREQGQQQRVAEVGVDR